MKPEISQLKTPVCNGRIKKEISQKLRFGCVLPQRCFEQVSHGVGIELFHDIGAVCFHGFDTDA
jgi:hypothetical protein